MFVFPCQFPEIETPYPGLFRLSAPPPLQLEERDLLRCLQGLESEIVPASIVSHQQF
jgi:hypothetical protein